MNVRYRCLRWSGVALAMALLGGGCFVHHVSGGGPWLKASDLAAGDLLFQDLDCGPLCDAIEAVTQGVDGAQCSHIGIVSSVHGGKVRVVEAISAGVVETPLLDFLARSYDGARRPKVLVGRLEGPERDLIQAALAEARRHLGKPYDSAFEMRNDAFYCSELVYESFRAANQGGEVFSLQPMTFQDPTTDSTFPAWVDYYATLGVAIPEGEPGLNPGGISRSPVVKIVGAFGVPDGWTGQVHGRRARWHGLGMGFHVGGRDGRDVEEAGHDIR